MITLKKSFILKKSQLNKKFRVENNNLEISFEEKSGLTVKKLKEIAISHSNDRDRKKTKDDIIKYVEIGDVDINLGKIKSFRTFKGSEAPNNARRIMSFGDVIISTRRPTRGAIFAVPQEFDKEICTAFFISLTVLDWNEVDPQYLVLFLRTSLGRLQFQSMITETAYPVIAPDDPDDMLIIYPSIDVQRQLVKEYNETVDTFFSKINKAHELIGDIKQKIENFILENDAETGEIPKFGLGLEKIAEKTVDGEIGEKEIEGDENS